MQQRVTFWLATAMGLTLTANARAETLQSETYPITVHCAADRLDYAATLLAAVEEAWAFQVDGLGFPPPPPDGGSFGADDDFDVFVEPYEYGAGCHPGDPAAERPFGIESALYFDPDQIPDWSFPLVAAHELHHAIQAGVRPLGNNVSEAGAVYVSGLETGQAWALSYYLGFNEFQAHPDRSLDWEAELGDFYPYGGALYFAFLDEAYGDPSTMAIYKSMWDLLGTAEYSYYFAALGALVDFDAAYEQFSRWRYFVGPEDDGNHFNDLSIWYESDYDQFMTSVALLADLSVSDLPAADYARGKGPMPCGAVYLRIALDGLAATDSLRVEVAGDPATRWSLQTMLLQNGAPPLEQSTRVGADGVTKLELATAGYHTLVVAVVNLGTGDYSQGAGDWHNTSVSYSLQVVSPAPPETTEPEPEGCAAVPVSAGWTILACTLLLRRRRAGSGQTTPR